MHSFFSFLFYDYSQIVQNIFPIRSKLVYGCFVNLITIQSKCDRINKYLDKMFIKMTIFYPEDSYKTYGITAHPNS